MKRKNWLRSVGVWIVLAALAAIAAGAMFGGCNDHRFTPLADIRIYPDVIDYELQRTAQSTEQVLITNESVSARLEIFEFAFEDSAGTPLVEELTEVFDQNVALASLQETSNITGDAIVYTSYLEGVVSDVSCDDDSYCQCDPNVDGANACNLDVPGGTVEKERMGSMFVCRNNPINSAAGKVCMANYRYYNNVGETSVAVWGGETTADCTDNSNCSRLGPGYICDTDAKMCVSDIKATFSLDYGLEELVSVDSGVITNSDNAAVWTGIDGGALCLVDDNGNVQEETKFYGLNRCDQIALKQDMKAMDDGDQAVGYALYPRRQANFRLMVNPIEAGQAKFVAFCNGGQDVSMRTVTLVDPVGDQSCYNGDGELNTDLLSVNIDTVKIDQLPVRVLYAPDNAFEAASVLTGKAFTMRIFNSARVGGSYERTVSLTLPENPGGPPIPIIEIPEDQQDPEPLAVIHLDGRNSTSPFGEDRKPFEYFWEWAPGGRPAFAQDAVLIASTGTFDNPRSIMGKWTSEGYPKIYFPIAGLYKIRMKVKDSAGVPSGPNDDCPTCPEWADIAIQVKPSQKLHAELIWDRGDNVDMDLFLIRLREDGTFGVPAPYQDRLQPSSVAMPPCASNDDCFGGLMECDTTASLCLNSCDSDDDCKAVDLGWFCNEFSQCQENTQGIIECETDADCGTAFCNPSNVGLQGFKMICTKHDTGSLNDTCSHINKEPRWGAYDDIVMGCSGDVDCNGLGDDVFSCDDTCSCEGSECEAASFDCCSFACTSSAQCLSVSEQFICDQDQGVCQGNSLDDDPTLDIDDVNGWGPENISLKEPQTGRYRIVARLYADPNKVVSDDGPLSPVRAYVQIYLNGELALSKGIAHEFAATNTYWKVADIVWDETVENGDGYVEPICAGWTQTQCNNTEECQGWYGDDFQCSNREWGKYCSTCIGGEGTPEECNPTSTVCASDADCNGEATARTCASIKGSYCTCTGSNPNGLFSSDPYANPFYNDQGSSLFDPNGDTARSIWCDSPETTSFIQGLADGEGEKSVDVLSGGASCSSLYGGGR